MPATPPDPIADSHVAPSPPLSLQVRMVVLSYLAYFFYYFGRKHLGIATPAMVVSGFSETTIAWVQTAFGVCYAIGQFLNGALGDRVGPRIALTAGMILSGIATLAFGIFPFFGVLIVALSLNGLFQSTGWPSACKVVAQWVSYRHRGRVMGWWMTCYIFGSLAANLVAGYVLGRFGWREVFLVTGVIVIAIGIVQGLFLIDRPKDRGFDHARSTSTTATTDTIRNSFTLMIRNPAVLLLGLTYTGLKFVRYSFFAWTPTYLAVTVGLAGDSAAYVSNGFEVGGVLGLVVGGWVGDRFFARNRVRLALVALLGMIAAVLLYRAISVGGGIWSNAAGLAAIGFFLFIADSIVSGTAAQDIGGAERTASAAGIISGIGSTAQLFAGILPIWLKNTWGWDAVFVSFLVLAGFSCLAVLPVARQRSLEKA